VFSPDDGPALRWTISHTVHACLVRIDNCIAATGAGFAGTGNYRRPAAAAQTTIPAVKRLIAVWTEAWDQRLTHRRKHALRSHGGYGSRGSAVVGMSCRKSDRYTAGMRVFSHEFSIRSDGHGHVIDLSDVVSEWLQSCGASHGQVTVFVPGSTASVTTIEFEPGAVRDLGEALESLAPSNRDYHHDLRWGDGNGFSHLRAALMGPSLTVPVISGRCVLGTWQQIVLVECDLKPRERRVALSYVGATGDDD